MIHDKKSTLSDEINCDKSNQMFNKYTVNEEDFDISIDEGMNQNAEQLLLVV